MTLIEKLIEIQNELKAPKNQTNTFSPSKYKYRNCEDILEAVKPLLQKHGLALTLSDEPVLIGEWVFIRAVATLHDIDEKTITTTALARHSDKRKGFDDSQVTGSTSSYARKYALNGLFCIDDQKDADTPGVHDQQEKAVLPPVPGVAPIKPTPVLPQI
jgi:ERF superfamily protein